VKIGVLAVQGDFEAHVKVLESLGVQTALVKRPDELKGLDGLVLPGGESGAHLRIMKENGLFDAIRKYHGSGGAVYGTCAGLILAARNVSGPAQDSLGLIDIDVERNGYGRQIDSFERDVNGDPALTNGHPLRMVFIRAPRIGRVGPEVKVLLQNDGEPVAVREDRVLVTAFHPEIAGDDRVHRYFLNDVVQNRVPSARADGASVR
jgi:pyridoxal 5'-phosphate synthase pdxT subunit